MPVPPSGDGYFNHGLWEGAYFGPSAIVVKQLDQAWQYISKKLSWVAWMLCAARGKGRGDDVPFDWQPMPESSQGTPQDAEAVSSASSAASVRLTIAEAKAGLAATFGVSTEHIEIIVRG